MNKEWTGKYWNTRFIEYKETWYSKKDYEEYFVKHFALHEVHYDEMDNPFYFGYLIHCMDLRTCRYEISRL